MDDRRDRELAENDARRKRDRKIFLGIVAAVTIVLVAAITAVIVVVAQTRSQSSCLQKRSFALAGPSAERNQAVVNVFILLDGLSGQATPEQRKQFATAIKNIVAKDAAYKVALEANPPC
jgi:flagellar basal body-associated protein FliL